MRKKNDIRKKQVLKRKNFLPTLLLTIIFWLLLGALIYFVDPQTFGVIPLFFVTFFTTVLFTFSLLFAGSRRGFIAALSLTLYLILMYLGVGNYLNFVLILAIGICVELYNQQRSK
jgi:hypothetical protein